MNGLPYYKAYPRDFFEGTLGMDFEVKAAYRLTLDLIYQHGGKLSDDARFIAGILGCSVKKWNLLRSAMIAAGKLKVSGGFLANNRADKELEILRSFQDTQRKNASAPRKNNGLTEAMAKPRQSHTEPEPDISEGKPSDDAQAHLFPENPKPKPPPKARLPDDWALSDEGWAYARSQGIPDKVIEDEARGFHAYWTDRRDRDASKSARGWEQCWATRCRSIAGRHRPSGGMAFQAKAAGYGQRSSLASIVARRRLEGEV